MVEAAVTFVLLLLGCLRSVSTANLDWIYRPLAMSGAYFQDTISSFTVESLALHNATEF